MTGTAEAIALITRARTARELFGDDPAQAARRYRRLARLVHPDSTGDGAGDGARAAFDRLAELWREHRGPARTTIVTRRHSYELSGDPIHGDLANLYPAVHDMTRQVLVKMPRDPADGDLLEREAEALRRLAAEGDPRYLPYVPRLVESFTHHDAGTGVRRRSNVISRFDGFFNLAEVRAAHPGGLDPRDAAWMWRRLLVAIGLAHRAGVVHGAVLPEHVLIHPGDHGLGLVGWCASVIGGGRVPALVGAYADWYPPEVPARQKAGPGTDVFLATRCMEHLMGDRAPKAMRSFARGCTLPAPGRRPADAWRLLAELDDLLERLYGPRHFRPFTMPSRARTA
ncbi:molecular chaperone DnaJ [Actinomadura craniellae]|uniref:Molecular chaperone DnaJ n=1 Tax=Actinomadura craniellae TaxID=2231787 RepID=A0A365H287_9ACTN|nr:molecular chaperone DnaJ [Actinomadura craniellae]RAY13211.1 molecular chaperone DnaJ [Actinomadura craniellae]